MNTWQDSLEKKNKEKEQKLESGNLSDEEKAKLVKEIIENNKKIDSIDDYKLALNTIGMALSAPTDSIAGIAAAAASPKLAYEIGQYFKSQEEINKLTGVNNGELTTGQKLAHVAAHAVLGAAVAAIGGNDALTAGLAAGGAEAAVPVISNWLYQTDDPEKLTAEQKSTLTAIAGLIGTGVGLSTGGSVTDVASGSQLAQNAVENNSTRGFQRRTNIVEGIAEFTDPFALFAPINELKAALAELNENRDNTERQRQDKVNENLKSYLEKKGVHIQLETELINVNGQGVVRFNTEKNRNKLTEALKNYAQSKPVESKYKYFTTPLVWNNPNKSGTKFDYAVSERTDINWDLVRTDGPIKYIGKTNYEAGLAGLSPQLADGSFATLHHVGQKATGPLVEASTRYHGVGKSGQDILHSQFGRSKANSSLPINRNKFRNDTKAYWKNRASGIKRK